MASTNLSWLTVDTKTATGDKSIKFTAAEHTGRAARSGKVIFSASGTSNAELTVTQKAAAPIFDLETTEATASGAGDTVIISGWTNLAEFSVKVSTDSQISGITMLDGSDTKNITIVNTSLMQIEELTAGQGETAKYQFQFALSIPKNTTITGKEATIEYFKGYTQTEANRIPEVTVISQTNGSATLSVDPTSIEFEAAGGQKNVTVTSNTTWSAQ